MQRLLSITVMMSILIALPALAAAPVAYTFVPAGQDTYKVLADKTPVGYLLVGQKSGLLVGFDTTLPIEKTPYTTGKKILSTCTTVENPGSFDLGGRTVKAVRLSGAESLLGIRFPLSRFTPKDTWGFIDQGNTLVITGEDIGNGTAVIGTSANKLLDWGRAYFTALAFQSSVHKVAKLIDGTNHPTILDGNGDSIDPAYVTDLNTLIDQVMSFDKSVVYDYDTAKAGSNYVAKLRSATLEIHDATYGFLGYNLIGTSISNETYSNTQFFTVNYKNQFYMIKDTDVQTAYVWMNDKEAFLIDTGYYNADGFAARLLSLIGDRKLSVYVTHGHGDHYLNLVAVPTASIDALYLPEGETWFKFGPANGSYDLPNDITGRLATKVHYVKDGQELTVAGKKFQVISVPGHTPYGTGLLDISGRHFFSGDTLGTQAYFGGTNLAASTIRTWDTSLKHLSEVLALETANSRVDDVFMMHVNYPETKQYILWMKTIIGALVAKQEVLVTTPNLPKGSGLVVMENGKFLNQAQYDAVAKADISESELTKYCSVTYIGDK